jgi:uncharacterized protein
MDAGGGTTRFILGIIMFIAGLYLLLTSIHVHIGYGMRFGNVEVTTGYVLIPFVFGVGMVFFNAKSWIGWILMAGSLVMLVFGVVSSTQFTLRHMTAFELIMILVLTVGGIGLFLSSFRKTSN